MLLPTIFTEAECQSLIDLAERDGWLVSSDSVDGEPAWELNLLEYPAGKMAANRLRSAILNSSINTSLSGYRIYIRKYAPQTRASLAAHLDKSKLSFTASLNDDYAGGEFFYLDANDNEQTVALKKGDAVVFGGDLLHGVRPMQEGVRYSLVMHCK
jgi:hypothetical protein